MTLGLIILALLTVSVSCQGRLGLHDKPPLELVDDVMRGGDSSGRNVWSMRQELKAGRTSSRFRGVRGFSSQPHSTGRDQVWTASVVYQGKQFRIIPNSWDPDALVYGMLARTVNTSGWDVLDVVTEAQSSQQNDTALMYAAGLVEGYLTGDRIALAYANMMATEFPTDYSRQVLLPRVRDFFSTQFDWARTFAAGNPNCPIARHTGFVLAQLQGLIDGYLVRNDTTVKDPFVLHILNANGDLGDLITALNDTKADFFKRMSPAKFRDFVQASGRCSALIRVTPGLEKVFMGHSTWSGYTTMLRMYKHYQLYLSDLDTASRILSFSSYPGSLESIDDFYILDSGMVILETTNNVFNVSLYKEIKPQSLLSWQRVRVASHVARNGSHWGWAVAQQNSGTYNNQYMIIDMNRIKRNVSIDDGALTIVEQIPTLVVWSDQSAILRTGYFPSYNVPFHELIYNMSGYPDTVRQRGLDFSYQMAPRAKIFRREAPRVNDEEGMRSILRFNHFSTDPYSEGDPCYSICCRRDLRPPGPDAAARGCTDSKFTDLDMAVYMASQAVSGPTTGDAVQRLPPFSWSQYPTVAHSGLPMMYNFSWVTMSPTVLL